MMDGKVFVNGHRVDRLPAFVDPAVDRVLVAGREVSLRPLTRERAHGETGPLKRYLMVNKPERYLTSTADVEGEIRGSERKTVLDLVKMPGLGRMVPVGRLEFHASGLVLLTNDGELVNRLTHARYGVSKTYRVWVRGGLDVPAVQKLSEQVDKMCVRMAKRAGAPLRAGASIASVELVNPMKSAGEAGADVGMNVKTNMKRTAGGDERGKRGMSGRALDAAAERRFVREQQERAEVFEGVDDDGDEAAEAAPTGKVNARGVGEVDVRTGKRLGGTKTAIDVTLRGAAGKLKLPAMLTYLGLRIDKIMQVAIGDVELRDVGVGQWRPLTGQEIKSLKKSSRAPEETAPPVPMSKHRPAEGSVARRAEGASVERAASTPQSRGNDRERARQAALAERAAVEMASGWGEELDALDVDINAGGEGRFVDERARMSARGRAEAKARQEHRPEDGSVVRSEDPSQREGVPKAKADLTRGPLIKRFGSARRGGGGGGGATADGESGPRGGEDDAGADA